MDKRRQVRLVSRLHPGAFTLIELLVVVVILAILMAIAIPAYLSQQIKAKDAKAKQYLAYAYRAIRSGIPETNDKFPTNTSMVSWVQQSEPELTSAVGNCYALGSLTSNTVVVDQGSSSGNLTLCTRSDSGNVWKLTATTTSAPTFTDATVVPLTVSGNEITDATRATNVQGDGRSNDSSTGVWEGTTNLATNGGFESTMTGWSAIGGTVTRDTTFSKFGAASLKTLTTGTGAIQGPRRQDLGGLVANTTYTYSVWAWTPAGIHFGIEIDFGDGGGTFVNAAFIRDLIGTGGWSRFSVTGTSGANVAQAALYFSTENDPTIGAGVAFWIDGVQLEQKSFATPYVETNGATATRSSAAGVQAPSSLLNATQSWVAMRLRVGVPGTGDSQFHALFDWHVDANDQYLLAVRTGAAFEIERSHGGVNPEIDSPATWNVGDVLTIVAGWTAGGLQLSVNGSAFQTISSSTSVPTGLPANFEIGKGRVSNADGDVVWFACGTGTLADADATTINAFGNNDPKVSSFPSTSRADFVWNGVSSTGSLK
jgi:type IV pilus assembly protein PilA